ncbi:hypothetical protein JCM6882_002060 [Rhodosporidiobolus microsporus]
MKALPSLSATASSSAPTRPGSLPNPLVSSTTPPASEEPSPTDLLLATPPTLLKLFALCAPAIHAGATFVQLLTWTHPNFFGSLLVLLGWWGLCLFGQVVALYGVNAVIVVLIARKYFASAPRRGASGATVAPPSSMRHRARPATLSPAAYAQLINSANILATHVQALRSGIIHPLSLHFSFTPLRPSTPAPAYETAWLLITSYPFYLLLTYFVPLRYIFLALGSVAILWQAPFFTTLRLLVWRSAFVRWTCRLGLSVLKGGAGFRKEWSRTKSGLGIPGLIGKQDAAARRAAGGVEEKTVKKLRRSSSVGPAASPAVAAGAGPAAVGAEAAAAVVAAEDEAEMLADVEETEEGEDVQVQFTVFENQRWWVGLDWTHALLPGERASWTDPANNPANPPSSFTLPPPSIAYIPSPTRADPHSRLKKTTEWRWLDPEWKVLRSAIPTVTLPITSPTSGAPPSPSTEDGAPSTAASSAVPPQQHPASPTISRIAAAAGVQIPPSLASSLSSTPSDGAPANPSYTSPSSTLVGWDENSSLFAAWTVDDEGWQYGDNHFEKMGPRGGLGKYTRRRAWVRRAGLVERTERVSGPAPVAAAGTVTGAEADVAGGKKDGEGKKREGSVERTRKDGHGSEAAELVRRSSSKGGDSLRRRKSQAAGGGGGGDGKSGAAALVAG